MIFLTTRTNESGHEFHSGIPETGRTVPQIPQFPIEGVAAESCRLGCQMGRSGREVPEDSHFRVV